MSNEFNNENEDAIPAMLSDGESIIPNQYAEAIEELVEKYNELSQGIEDDEELEVVVEAPKPVEKKEDKPEKLAIYSSRNVTWNGVGKVYIGYNIVTQEQADKWLTRDHTRLATPEEVAKEFGL